MEVKSSGNTGIYFEGEANRISFWIGSTYERNCVVKDDSKVAGGMELS